MSTSGMALDILYKRKSQPFAVRPLYEFEKEYKTPSLPKTEGCVGITVEDLQKPSEL